MNENERERDAADKNECPVCDKSFGRRDAMKRHLLGIHGPEYVEPDPRARVRLRARVDQAILKGKKLLRNPVEITAPEAGKVRVRSIKPGAPSKDEDEDEIEAEGEESEVPEAKVRGPKEGPAAVPTAVPARKDRGQKAKDRARAEPEVVDEESLAEPEEGPGYPAFEPGDLLRFDGADFKVTKDGRLQWVVFPSKPGPRLEQGDLFYVGERLFEIRRHTYHNLGVLPYLQADEVHEDAEDVEEPADEENGDGDEEDHEEPRKKGLLGLGWMGM